MAADDGWAVKSVGAAPAPPVVDPWSVASVGGGPPAADPWAVTSVDGQPPGKKGPANFADWVSRTAATAAGSVEEAVGGLVKSVGEFGDLYAQSQAKLAGDAGAMADPLTGVPIQVPASMRPQFAQIAQGHTKTVSPYTDPAAAAITASGVKLEPANRNWWESLVHTAGGFATGLGAAAVDPMAMPIVFGMQGFGEAYDEAKAKGATEEQAQAAGVLNFGTQGGVTAVPFAEGLGKLAEKIGGAAVKKLLDEGAAGLASTVAKGTVRAASDAVMGAAMQGGSNVVAKTNYDPNRDLTEGVAESAGGMALAGAAMHAGGKVAEGAGSAVGDVTARAYYKAASDRAAANPPPAPAVPPPSSQAGPLLPGEAPKPTPPIPPSPTGVPPPANELSPYVANAPHGDPLAEDVDHHIGQIGALSTLIPQLEGGVAKDGTARVSQKGAVGEYQIEPETARELMGPGFDVFSLTDPDVNRAVGQRLIANLYNRFNGDTNAVLIAYNAGPGRANEYMKAGEGTALEATVDKSAKGGIRYTEVPSTRDESFLPLETQRYLANARRLAGTVAEAPAETGEIRQIPAESAEKPPAADNVPFEEALSPHPETAPEAPEKTEEAKPEGPGATTDLSADLHRDGDATVDGVRYRVELVTVGDREGWKLKITENGITTTLGGAAHQGLWTKGEAVNRAMQEAGIGQGAAAPVPEHTPAPAPVANPTDNAQAQGEHQGQRATENARDYQPAAIPPPEPQTEQPDQGVKADVKVGDTVDLRPDMKSVTPRTEGRTVVGVDPDGHIHLDGGLSVGPGLLRKPGEEPTSPPAEEAEHGLQGTLPSDLAGSGSEPVPGAHPQRDNGPAPAGEERGGAHASEPDAGARAEGTKRPAAGSAGAEVGGGEGLGSDARLSAPDGGERTARRSPDANVTGENYRIEPGALAEDRGPKTKARDNIAAIKLAKQLIDEDRPATKAEQEILAKYVGWGGLAGAFPGSDGLMTKGMEDVGAELRAVLADDEYAAAAASTQFAHYTAEHIIRGMWKAVEDMGFKAGRVFEPGMGVGHFLGLMPPDIAARSHYEGVEMDNVTAMIAKLLYPKSGVRQGDFVEMPIPEGSFDLVIGNPPFSDTVIRADPKYAARGFMLHDYFFAKSMDSLRPGGLMAFVTSAGTMNKGSPKAREYLAQRAEFLGGVRLPSDAFKQNAGTEVTTDILFFQKRAALIDALNADEPWTQAPVRSIRDHAGQMVPANVSRYFTEHPEQILGEEGAFDKLYQGRYAVHSRPGVNLEDELPHALDRLPKGVMTEPETPQQRAARDFATDEVKDGSYYVRDGKLMQFNTGAGEEVPSRGAGVTGAPTAADREKIMRLIPIRDALRDVFRHDLSDNPVEAAAARAKLNEHYDAFVAKHGPINKAEFQFRRPTIVQQEAARAQAREEARDRGEPWVEGHFDADAYGPGRTMAELARLRQNAREKYGAAFDEGSFLPSEMPDVVIEKRPNIQPFMDDPESYRLRSIEDYNDQTGEARKKDIFYRNVITKEMEPELRSAQDGVLWSLNKHGRLDLDAVAAKMGRPKADLVAELGDSIFRDPRAPDTYYPADEYLSGDIYDKLADARTAALNDPTMERNVSALEAAIPAPLAPSEIHMSIGMPWIPVADVHEFIRDHLGIGNIKPKFSSILGTWMAEPAARPGPRVQEWSTGRMSAHEILKAALNRLPPKIYDIVRDEYGGEKRVFNEIETEAALIKYQAMNDAFDTFLRDDQERLDGITHVYNTTQNRVALRNFDGSYLTTPGVADGWRFRPHQQRVIARVIQSGDTYMAHAVGAGKTSAMIGSGMEMRRLGLVKKPIYVVPNHMLAQFAKEFYEQYPTARIAVADDRRFHTSRRKQFVANVAQDDLDAVILTHPAFGMIPLSAEYQGKIVGREMDKLDEALRDLGKSPENRITVKKIENQKAKLAQRLKQAMAGRKDQTMTFEQMGVDFAFVDEAHMFRKLSFATKQGTLKGLDPEGSDAAFDLHSKLSYLDEKSPGRSHVLASGTPVTNTMAELYTLSRYMQPRELERRGLSHFDSWASTFGDRMTNIEQTATGAYEPVTRFARFVNTPELYKMVAQIMDVVTPGQLDQYVVRPKLEGGKRQFHLADRTPWLDNFQAELGARVAAIKMRGGKPAKGDDILFSVIGDGRLGAIDPRLMGASPAEFDPRGPSKLNNMIENVHRIWSEGHKTTFYDPKDGYKTPLFDGPSTQMIFTDLGLTGRERGGNPIDFTTPAWIKRELVRRGIPANEIAFIADAKSAVARQKLFNDMNEGKVRVLVGSTKKMGTGVNAQRRLRAIHNLDPLWYPADDEQRNGRGIRQGNLNPEIGIHDYSTKGTYDATMWQMMGRKARFIEQFFRGDPNLRDMEDLGEASQFEQASAMSTTDERVIELTDYRHQLDRALRQKAAHEREQASMRGRLKDAAGKIEYHDQAIANRKADIAQRVDTRGDAFSMKVGGKTYAKRTEAATALGKAYEAAFPALEKGQSAKIGDLGGFPIMVRNTGITGHLVSFDLRYTDGSTSYIADHNASPGGIIKSVEATLPKFEELIGYHERQKEDATAAIASLQSQMGKPFEGDEEITRLRLATKSLEAQIKATAAGGEGKGAPKLAPDEAPKLPEDDTSFQRPAEPGAAPEEPLQPIGPNVSGTEAKESPLLDEVRGILDRLVPGAEQRPAGRLVGTAPDENGNMVDIPVAGATWGTGLKTVVAWAMDDTNPMNAARHEAIHALRRMGLIREAEWNTLASQAMAEGWGEKYNIDSRYPGLTPEQKLEEAVAERYADLQDGIVTDAPVEAKGVFERMADAFRQIVDAVRRMFGKDATAEDIFQAIESGEVGAREPSAVSAADGTSFARKPAPAPIKPPDSPIDRMLGEKPDKAGRFIARKVDAFFDKHNFEDLRHAVRMGINPMATGTEEMQAEAKTFANHLRGIAWNWQKVDAYLSATFDKSARERMWEAADEESVIRQQQQVPGPGQGLNKLAPAERAMVENLQARADRVFSIAVKLGMTKAEKIPSYVPRMVIERAAGGEARKLQGGGKNKGPRTAGQMEGSAKLKTSADSLKHRKYLTTAETEAAAKNIDASAEVVRDIRTLALATKNLEQAVAGRILVNKVIDMGKSIGQGLAAKDKANSPDWTTWNHPALQRWKPDMIDDPQNPGKMTPKRDQAGAIQGHFEPIYIHKSIEGPMRAVLSTPDPRTWRAVMTLKSKAIGAIMYNPLTHNMVIWGKAFAASAKLDPLAPFTGRFYREGYVVKNDPALSLRAIRDGGLVPVAHNYVAQEVGAIADDRTLDPTHDQWSAQMAGAVAKLFNKGWEQPTVEAMHDFHDFVSNRMLWDQVQSLQFGLWKALTEHYQAHGFDQLTADRMAGIMANGYAGAVPPEAMSKLARGILNGLLFSRSFHVTNLQQAKMVIAGLPTDVQAQIGRDAGKQVLTQAQGAARAQAMSTIFLDTMSAVAIRSLAAMAVAFIVGQAVNWPWNNEPGKTNKVMIGHEPNGTAVYLNIPVGKFPDELTEWTSEPLTFAKQIMFGPPKVLGEYMFNADNFGRPVYDAVHKDAFTVLKNTWGFIGRMAGGMLPVSTFADVANLAAAPLPADKATAFAALMGQMTGLTLSHGYPGGPAEGELSRAQEGHRIDVADAKPGIIAAWQRGDKAGALAAMNRVHMLEWERQSVIAQAQERPRTLGKRKLEDFATYGSPEARAAFAQERQAAQPATADAGP